jgi:hypothetical protein
MKPGREPIPAIVRTLREEAGTGSGTIQYLADAANEIMLLRKLLAFTYCAGEPGLYGDDGELQLGSYPHPIDFNRDPAKLIEERMHARGMDSLVAWIKANPEEAAAMGYRLPPNPENEE